MYWTVYMLRCGDSSLYTGITNNLPRRLAKHRSGEGAKFTRGRGFLTVAWKKNVVDKSAALQLEASLKKLSKKNKEELVLSSNPLLKTYLKHQNEKDPRKIVKLRDKLVSKYSWAIPTEEAIRQIALFSPVVEMGAGTGYWASLLKKAGVDVVAYDRSPPGSTKSLTAACNPWHIGSKQHTKILQGTPETLKEHAYKTLFLCWPPRGSMAAECLRHWNGRFLVHVGEFGGVTSNEKFRDSIEKDYGLLSTVSIPRWPGMNDMLTIWKRKS